MSEEKRKFKRLKCKDGGFAAFTRPNELIRMGQLQDISLGGLCVRYLAIDGDQVKFSEVKIFGSNSRFIHVDRIQCNIVYDQEVPEYSWAQISTRRCGVEFKNLSVKHRAMIQDFIDHFASEESTSQNSVG
jgi:c-di-GMP-binding flagellar brake protein YcgR